jgi:hypothetical protein
VAVRARGLDAVAVDCKGVLGDLEAALDCDTVLARLDFFVVEFLDMAAVEAD